MIVLCKLFGPFINSLLHQKQWWRVADWIEALHSHVPSEIAMHFVTFDLLPHDHSCTKITHLWNTARKISAKTSKGIMFYIWAESRHYSTWQHIMNCLRRQPSSDNFTSSLHPPWVKPRQRQWVRPPWECWHCGSLRRRENTCESHKRP